MDKVRDLLIFFLKVSIGLFVVVLVIWLTASVPRSKKNTVTASSTPKVDILPSPRKYSGFFTNSGTSSRITTKTPEFNTFAYNGVVAFSSSTTVGPMNIVNFNQNGTSYNSYVPVAGQQTNTNTAFSGGGNTTRSLNIRNLSIYEGGAVYTGLSFIGEARSSMFRDGKFPIVVIDQSGKVIGISAAIAQSTWSVPGWVRFETRITYPLPNKVPCTMIFEENLTQAERTRAPLRVPLPIRCN